MVINYELCKVYEKIIWKHTTLCRDIYYMQIQILKMREGQMFFQEYIGKVKKTESDPLITGIIQINQSFKMSV